MSLIVAARFSTFEEAERASNVLFANGFGEQDVSVFFVSPPGQNHALRTGGDEVTDRGALFSKTTVFVGAGLGAVVGVAVGILIVSVTELSVVVATIAGGIGAYAGSLFGALNGMRGAQKRPRPGHDLGVRHSGVLVAVHANPGGEGLASKLLRDAGGKDVERANGRWRNGKWLDFDPVQPPVLSDKVPVVPA